MEDENKPQENVDTVSDSEEMTETNGMFSRKYWECTECGQQYGVWAKARIGCPKCGGKLVFHDGN